MGTMLDFEADLVSRRDRMVSMRWPDGRLVTVTVVKDPDGQVSIGLGYSPDTDVRVVYIGDDPPQPGA